MRCLASRCCGSITASRGRATIFFLLGVVWASDIGAYAFGRLIGGPKLAPALSPNKTWAGAAGGLICALLVGFAAAHWGHREALQLLAATAAVAIAAQLGDLGESFAKRHFHVKDSGGLIPGHGGLLDRLDIAAGGCYGPGGDRCRRRHSHV